MELSSQEATGEIPIPINSTYVHGHTHHNMIHHDATPHHIIPAASNNGQNVISPSSLDHQEHHHHNHNHHEQQHVNNVSYKKMVRYKECLKNHAASMGSNATDGCGEFMPSGEEGTIEALTCSACNCHRNFHRKEIEGEPYNTSDNNCSLYPYPQHHHHHLHHHNSLNRVGSRKVILGHPHKSILPPEALGYPTRATPHQMIMSYNIGGGGGGGGSVPSESDEMEDVVGSGGGNGGGGGLVRPVVLHHHHQLHAKKRHRTKFTQEQKDKMLNFAEKVGWKIQKQEESVVQQFCQEIGVKRRVLKVWMHNNKHNLAKKLNSPPPPPPTTATATTT